MRPPPNRRVYKAPSPAPSASRRRSAARSGGERAAPNRRQGPAAPPPADDAEVAQLPRVGLRIGFVGLLLAAGAAVLVGRAWQLQITSGARYQNAAQRQSEGMSRVQAKRGVIKDRHGAELAISVDVDSIFAEPKRIQDPEAVAKRLAPVLGIRASKLAKRLGSGRAFVYLKRRAGPEIAEKVRALDLPGIGIRPEPRRFYSNRDLAAHVLGFTDHSGQGVAGLERRFDEVLRGRSYEVPSLRDALGKRVLSEGFVPEAVLEGDDVELTLDRHVQHVAEVELAKAVTENGGKAGVAIVAVPKTGEILALASYPSFNPNNLRGVGPDAQLNRAVSMIYEPGSTMKLVTLAAALEDGLIGPNDSIDCENGLWKVGRRTIRDANHKYGVLSIGEVLKLSSNICSAKVGFKIGRENLHRWIERFGIGAPTGVELPGELRGLLRPASQWRDIALANIAFGQGLSVTPLQVTQVASTLANGGVRVAPRIVRATIDATGQRTVPPPTTPERVVSARTAAEMTRMMIEVTQEGGTAPAAAIPGFRVAGKTGTSQKIDPVTRAYSHSLYVASFVGFVPAEAPEVVVLVMVDEPERSIYGGTVAAPAFRRIATAALGARAVFPDDPEARAAFLTAAREASAEPPAPAPAAVARAELTADVGEDELSVETGLSARARALLGETARPAARRPVVAPDEAPDAPVEADVPAPEAWSEGTGRTPGDPEDRQRMPNFAGLSPREVVHRSAEVRCDLVLIGTGRAVKQSPRPGTILVPGSRCEVTLAPRG
jgi:cell division protein FtsI (penicillin-binding protein 3)